LIGLRSCNLAWTNFARCCLKRSGRPKCSVMVASEKQFSVTSIAVLPRGRARPKSPNVVSFGSAQTRSARSNCDSALFEGRGSEITYPESIHNKIVQSVAQFHKSASGGQTPGGADAVHPERASPFRVDQGQPRDMPGSAATPNGQSDSTSECGANMNTPDCLTASE